ncbi:hypothetical protein K1719_007355 [Acacia pycnantha]|nr:hypothetical protein K1719_007355 [Acacia pycnantha]
MHPPLASALPKLSLEGNCVRGRREDSHSHAGETERAKDFTRRSHSWRVPSEAENTKHGCKDEDFWFSNCKLISRRRE